MQNFKSIESLRAYMAWWVVFSHGLGLIGLYDTGSSWLNLPIKLIAWAGMPVNIFIIVSGFVITHLMLSKQEAYSVYITRRLFRIFPIFLVCLLFAMSLDDLRQLAYVEVSFHPNKDARMAIMEAQHEHFWSHLMLHLTLMHGLVPDSLLQYSTSAFLGPAWSLSLEWQFYLLAPIIIGLMMRGTLSLLATAGVLYLAGVFVKSGALGHWNYPAFLPLSIQYFLIGIISRLLIERFKVHAHPWELPLVALITLLLANPIEAAIWISFFAIALSEAGRIRLPGFAQPGLRFFVLNKWVGNLGKWSYSTYLIHVPLYSLVVGGAAAIFGVGAIDLQTLIMLLLACIPVIIAASWVLYSSVETGGITLGKRVVAWLRNRSAPEVAAVSPVP